MVEVFPVQLPRLSGKQSRRAYVYLPDALSSDPDARYPVLYMFDGHNVFFDEDATYGKSWGMQAYMDETETPLIIVAVECSHAPNNGRLSEYSPFTFQEDKLGRIRGRGRLTMEWMTQELKPMIDANYPTLPQREATFIAGSSMGGLMSLYALLEYNHVFSRAAALSPSIWLAAPRLLGMVRKAELAPDTVLYMDYGSREIANHPGILHSFSLLTSRLMEKGVWVNSRIVPNGDHCEACWEEQIPFFMQTLLYERE